MAIDRIKKITILCASHASSRLMRAIHDLGVVEITDATESFEGAQGCLERDQGSAEEVERNLQRVGLVLSLLDTFAPEQTSFVAGLAPVPLVVDPRELDEALHRLDFETHYSVAAELDDLYRQTERAIADVQSHMKELEPLEELPFALKQFHSAQRVRLVYGLLSPKRLEALEQDPEAARLMAWEAVTHGAALRKNGSGVPVPPKKGESRPLLFGFLPEDEDAARKLLAAHGLEEIALPALPGKVRDHIREYREDLVTLHARMDDIRARVEALAPHRRLLKILRAYWEGMRRLNLARSQGLCGKWVHVCTGYVRAQDLDRLSGVLQHQFPEASLLVEDPAPGEDVPVSLSLPPAVRPIQMIVNLFGLPLYETFDPSPFILINFYVFFGICFSDMAYGIMLVALSLYIMRKTRSYEGLYNFAKLTMFCGLSTIVFGALLGSFLGDLYTAAYMGENNLLLRMMNSLRVVDPLEKPILVLLISLVIGMINQFYGIILKGYGALKRGNKAEALFDSGLWLIILPGFIIVVGSAFTTVPPGVLRIGLVLFAVGAVGLILTQGREAKGIVGKFLTGVVSLYGVVGSYGLTAFVGDTMSYSRLLALGLTTSIVSLSFNMMAGLLRPIPCAGFFLFVLVVVIGHVFNFAINVLGAFVHSMRLIFVEFFGRFYQGGARPFAPLGFNSRTAVLKKTGPS